MFFTARQLDDLHKSNGSNGHVLLPYRARLSPLAQDWVRERKIVLGYGDAEAKKAPAPSPPLAASQSQTAAADDIKPGTILFWCDGPCGPAKAALTAQAKESPLKAIEHPADAKRIVPVIKALAAEIKSGRAAAGVLVVENAAVAMVFANRCPSLRAVVGTCLEAVEQGIQQVAANVLVIEHPHKTLQQTKNLLGRFVQAKRVLSEEVKRQLQELSSCA